MTAGSGGNVNLGRSGNLYVIAESPVGLLEQSSTPAILARSGVLYTDSTGHLPAGTE